MHWHAFRCQSSLSTHYIMCYSPISDKPPQASEPCSVGMIIIAMAIIALMHNTHTHTHTQARAHTLRHNTHTHSLYILTVEQNETYTQINIVPREPNDI